jgi:hypothetical protein
MLGGINEISREGEGGEFYWEERMMGWGVWQGVAVDSLKYR